MSDVPRCGKPTNRRRGGRPCQMRLRGGKCLVHDLRPKDANAQLCRQIGRLGGQAAALKNSARLKGWVGEKHPRWKGDQAQKHSGRHRAQRLYALGACERCGAEPGGETPIHRHHKDENPLNNAPDNIEMLCEPCHVAEHNGRYAWFAQAQVPAPERVMTVEDLVDL